MEELPPFRLAVTTLCTIDGYDLRNGESVEHARWELIQEVQAKLSEKFAELNREYDLDLGTVDVRIHEIAGVTPYGEEVSL
jgi:hypothetical protein